MLDQPSLHPMTGDTQGTPAQAPGASSCAGTGLGTAGTATGTTAGLAGTAGPATSPSTEDPRDFRKALSFLPPPPPDLSQKEELAQTERIIRLAKATDISLGPK